MRRRSLELVPPYFSELRLVLLGNSCCERSSVGNFLLGETKFSIEEEPDSCMRVSKQQHESGEWRGKSLTLVKTSAIFTLSVEAVREEMKNCVTLCSPGPNVLLLLVKPSDFTEENRKTLKFILSFLGQDAFKCAMVITTHEGNETSSSVNELLTECGGRHYNLFDNNHEQLMEKIENIVCENKGTFLTFTEETMRPKSEPIKAALNLVVCGRRGSGKTSAAKSILGQTELHSASNSSECIINQGEVCGR
ncbi:hypothetical protein Q5P01_015363 [Channa striata]|uniref:AIG1-type G domain-containing protein n=1 Tax=Channa striata TaxID=64152 RepID=A0AA88MHV1_CHASR|nr:hypothetical protein Q5P01_015363 [Channa striata]